MIIHKQGCILSLFVHKIVCVYFERLKIQLNDVEKMIEKQWLAYIKRFQNMQQDESL